MPEWAETNIQRFRELNTEYEIMVHGEESILEEYQEIAHKIKSGKGIYLGNSSIPANLSDLARYSILESSGGWYFDADIYPLKPVSEIERDYQLDGDKLFLVRQKRDEEAKANSCYSAILAIGTSAKSKEIMQTVKELVLVTNENGYLSYGPDICSKLVGKRKSFVEVAECNLFFGIGPEIASLIYDKVLDGDLTACRKYCTKGQLPYTLHLWAQGHRGKIMSKKTPEKPEEKTKIAYLCGDGFPINGVTKSFGDAIRKGLELNGWQVKEVRILSEENGIPDLCIVWNHKQSSGKASIEYADRVGCKVLIMELGFFDRLTHCQIDSEGFSHTASWGKSINDDLTDLEQVKLKNTLPEISPTKKRDGYILVIGQVGSDTQLDESEVRGMPQLEKVLARNTPARHKIYFRPHPIANDSPHPMHTRLERLPLADGELQAYRENQQSATLAEALKGASFIITINSTSILEALVMGVPVLAFGPYLGIDAGAVRKATLATIKDDIEAMIKGWTPDQESVNRFLWHIVSNQHSIDDLKKAEYTKAIIESL